MRIKLHLFLFMICCFLLLGYYSCKNTETDPVDIGYYYYPTNPGHWVLYEVDSTFYNDFTHTVIRQHFRVKEYLQSTYTDMQGRPTQRMERYKSTDSVQYYLKDVWSLNLTQSTAELVEENVRYVKLVFPIRIDKYWNGNAFNDKGPQEYTYANIYEPYIVDSATFDSTITVIQALDSNLIGAQNQVEVYAKNIGLIYKRFRDVKKQPDPLHDSVISGVDYRMRIITYGN